MSPDICDPVSISTPVCSSSPAKIFLYHRYRRSPIQVSALWRPVCQKVCPPPVFHLPPPHSAPFFPNSDLLSRHVNKCHPNEKPLVSSAPSRRKGTSSASRATTSKQACDQCVQSTLPCDGANPCGQSLVFLPLTFSHISCPFPSQVPP